MTRRPAPHTTRRNPPHLAPLPFVLGLFGKKVFFPKKEAKTENKSTFA
jgi:hypothetical protein